MPLSEQKEYKKSLVLYRTVLQSLTDIDAFVWFHCTALDDQNAAVVGVLEKAEALLRFCYPVLKPKIEEVMSQIMMVILGAAEEYDSDTEGIVAELELGVEFKCFISAHPQQTFAISCVVGQGK